MLKIFKNYVRYPKDAKSISRKRQKKKNKEYDPVEASYGIAELFTKLQEKKGQRGFLKMKIFTGISKGILKETVKSYQINWRPWEVLKEIDELFAMYFKKIFQRKFLKKGRRSWWNCKGITWAIYRKNVERVANINTFDFRTKF